MRKFLKIAAGALVAAGLGTAASATTATTTFTVTANVASACTIGASNLAFATYSGSQLNINTTVTANCPAATTYNVGLNQGTSTGSTVSNRHVQATGGAQLSYGLYQDAAFTTNWGNTVGTDTVAGTGTGSAQNLTVYGKMAAGQSLATTGANTDTITATITF